MSLTRGWVAAVWLVAGGAGAEGRVVTASAAWLRDRPSETAKKIARLRVGHPVEVVRQAGGWAEVPMGPERRAYLRADLLGASVDTHGDGSLSGLERLVALDPTDPKRLTLLRDAARAGGDVTRAEWTDRLLRGDVPVWLGACHAGVVVIAGRDVPGRGFVPLKAPQKLSAGRRKEIAEELAGSDWFTTGGVQAGPFVLEYVFEDPDGAGRLKHVLELRGATPCVEGTVFATRPIAEAERGTFDFAKNVKGLAPSERITSVEAFTASGLDVVTLNATVEVDGPVPCAKTALLGEGGKVLATAGGEGSSVSHVKWLRYVFGGRELGVVLTATIRMWSPDEIHVWVPQGDGGVQAAKIDVEAGGC